MSLLADLRHTRFVRRLDGPVQLIHPDDSALIRQGPSTLNRYDSVYNPVTGLGSQQYDKGAVARPNQWILPLSAGELSALYAHNGITRRLIDIIPQRACRRGWSVPQIGTEDRRLGTWGKVSEAMSMARLYGGSALLMVTEDDVAAEFRSRPLDWLRQPLDLERVGRVVALQVFDAIEAQPCKWDRDIRSPGYRGPAEWQISADGFRAQVHASRVIWFRGARRPTSEARSWGRSTLFPDDSALQALWDEIRRLTETLQGGATMAQELRESVLKIGQFSSKMTGDEGAELETRLSLMARVKGLLNMILIGENDSYENHSNPPTGFSELSAGAWEALAAASGVPQVILMGSTPGGLNTDGESSWEGFRQLVSSYQETNRPELEQLYTVIYAQQDGPTQGQQPDSWDLVFAPLDEPNEATIAETRNMVATTDQLYLQAGVYSAADVARCRFGPGGYAFDLSDVSPNGAKPPTPIGSAQPGAPVPAPPKIAADAVVSQSVCILVPAVDPGLAQATSQAIGQTLTTDGEPHLTVLYLGELVDPASVAEVVDVLTAELATTSASVLERGAVRAFPFGPKGTPIVLEFDDGWGLSGLHDRLLVRLAHLVTAKQHPRYRPHLTLGYAAAELSTEAVTALVGLDVADVRVPVAEVRVMQGSAMVASRMVGG